MRRSASNSFMISFWTLCTWIWTHFFHNLLQNRPELQQNQELLTFMITCCLIGTWGDTHTHRHDLFSEQYCFDVFMISLRNVWFWSYIWKQFHDCLYAVFVCRKYFPQLIVYLSSFHKYSDFWYVPQIVWYVSQIAWYVQQIVWYVPQIVWHVT